MARELDLAKTAMRGAIHLLSGKIASKMVGIVGSLLLIRLLTPEGYGDYNIAMIAPGLLNTFFNLGINAALTKMLAEYKMQGKFGMLKAYSSTGLSFILCLSVGLTIFCYLFADFFAVYLIDKPSIAPLIRVASLLITARMMYVNAEAILIGLDATKEYALIMILMEILNATLPNVLIVSGLGVFGALVGVGLGTLSVGIVSILVIYRIVRKMVKDASISLSFIEILKTMLRFSIPLRAGKLTLEGLGRIRQTIVARYVLSSEIGLYNGARKMLNPLTYLTEPINAILFPLFSKIDGHKEPETLKKIYMFSVKYASLIYLPSVLIISVLAQPLISILLGADYAGADFYLVLIALGMFDYGLGITQVTRLLTSQGDTSSVFLLNMMIAAIRIPLIVFIVPRYGILGLLLVNLTTVLPVDIVRLLLVRKKFDIGVDIIELSRLYASLLVTAVVLQLILIPFTGIVKIVIGGCVGYTVFVIMTILFKFLRKSDLNMIQQILDPQPLIGRISRKLMPIVKRLART
jgi:O-antigen/teichoic acid export membrane protein